MVGKRITWDPRSEQAMEVVERMAIDDFIKDEYGPRSIWCRRCRELVILPHEHVSRHGS